MELFIQYYLAFLVNTQFSIGSLKLIFIGYVALSYFFIDRKTQLGIFPLILLALFAIGSIGSLIFMLIDIAAYKDAENVLLRNRSFFIEIFFAIALYLYLQKKTIDYILQILLIGIAANALLGTYELITAPRERISMLFPEPSAAGYYYMFVFFILVEKFKQRWPVYVTRYFIIIGLAIGSKAQYVLLIVIGFLHYISPKKIILFGMSLILFLSIFRAEITSIPTIKYNLRVLNIYMESGLKNFKESNGVWGTYVTRVSAIDGSIRCIIQNPLGIGFGSYNSWFRVHMAHVGLDNPEVNAILSGRLYASSKSNLLELFVATGIFGMVLYFYIGNYFYRYRKKYSYLFKSFLMLTLASLFVELNPMFTYITILWVLLEKERQNLQLETT